MRFGLTAFLRAAPTTHAGRGESCGRAGPDRTPGLAIGRRGAGALVGAVAMSGCA